MPRRRSRYGRLLAELKKSKGEPKAGTEADHFLKFLTGEKKIEIKNKPDENELKRYNLALHPFAVEGDDDTAQGRIKVGITAYSYAGLDAADLVMNDCGLHFIEGGEKENVLFYPALLRPSFKAGSYTGDDDKVSAVTGNTYKYVPTRTFSIPFGRTTQAEDADDGAATSSLEASDELDVLRHLKTTITAGSAADSLKTIGYEPEYFKDVSGAKDAESDSDIPNASVPFDT